MKRTILIIIAIALIAFGTYRLTHKNAVQTETPKEIIAPIHVTTLSMQDGAGSSRDAVYQASVESVQNTSVKAGASGTLTSLRVRVGDRVSVGQLLATIENPESSVDMTDASLRNADIVQTEIKVSQLKKSYQEASRVYDQDHNFTDYDLHHADLEVTITDPDAYFYRDEFTDRLDHSPDTLGIK